MAITAKNLDTHDGRPSSWSAAIDNITSGAEENGEKRLFLISAGNVHPHELTNTGYPDTNILHSIEDPGQSWNALTVGAYAKDINFEIPFSTQKYTPVADAGELSPFSSTSISWDKKWPIKPEIVLDGGNVITNGNDFSSFEDVSLLTTNSQPFIRLFSTTHGTSAAVAQASWMAAQLFTHYPHIWPETVRALLVHSATWSDKMINQFCKDNTKKKDLKPLLRSCGYGIPNIEKAIRCLDNSVNLVIEAKITPYNTKKMNEMHVHKIPWPKQILKELGENPAKRRITLSYFIEPSPENVGWKNKYQYRSHGLSFDVINHNETLDDFTKRVNKSMRGEDSKDKGEGTSGADRWRIGKNNRNTGSIHSDIREDNAIGLCNAEYVAVFPVGGWWHYKKHLKKSESVARYSIIISIETPETTTKLYTAIIAQIQNKTIIEI